jgi:hypothetical protein
MSSQSNPVLIRATVDIAESVRRGKPSPTTTIIVPLPEVCVAVRPEELPALAGSLGQQRYGHWSLYTQDTLCTKRDTLDGIPTPDIAGIVEAWRAGMVVQAKIAADAEAAKVKQAVEHAKQVALAVAVIEADVSLVSVGKYGVETYATAEDALLDRKRTDYINGAGIDSLPASTRKIWEAEKTRREGELAARKAAEKASADAKEARIVAAVDARLNDTQRAMRERGLLHVDGVRKAVLSDDRKVVVEWAQSVLGDGYHCAEQPDWRQVASSLTQKRFRMLTHVEKVLGQKATPLADESGGKLRIVITAKSALGQDVKVEITYPADL